MKKEERKKQADGDLIEALEKSPMYEKKECAMVCASDLFPGGSFIFRDGIQIGMPAVRYEKTPMGKVENHSGKLRSESLVSTVLKTALFADSYTVGGIVAFTPKDKKDSPLWGKLCH